MNAEILAVVARWEQAQADMAGLCFAGLTAAEVLAIQKRLEHGYRAQPAVDHQLIHQLTAQATPAELGANSWPKVLSKRCGSPQTRPSGGSSRPSCWGRAPP